MVHDKNKLNASIIHCSAFFKFGVQKITEYEGDDLDYLVLFQRQRDQHGLMT